MLDLERQRELSEHCPLISGIRYQFISDKMGSRVCVSGPRRCDRVRQRLTPCAWLWFSETNIPASFDADQWRAFNGALSIMRVILKIFQVAENTDIT